MPNRIEARSAKAALTNATGRLPLLRLFSTPLNVTGTSSREIAKASFSFPRVREMRPGSTDSARRFASLHLLRNEPSAQELALNSEGDFGQCPNCEHGHLGFVLWNNAEGESCASSATLDLLAWTK